MNYFDQHRIINDEYSEKFIEHHNKYKCTHKIKELKERTISGGSIQYIYQCTKCGRPQGGAIKRDKAFKLNSGNKPTSFNQELYESWESEQGKEFSALHEARETEQNKLANYFGVEEKRDKEKFFTFYKEHLKTNKWQIIREKVFKRANNICEGCLEEKATQVHHLDYRNVGDELLFQLVAICDNCHDKCHPK